MPVNADVMAQRILDNPAEFLPSSAMEHVKKAQEELAKALEEISKFADPEHVKKNQAEFQKLYNAVHPTATSSIDFNKKLMDNVYNKLRNYQVDSVSTVMDLEQKFYADRESIKETDILKIRGEIMDKIKGMIDGGTVAGRMPGGGHAAVPAAVAAGAAVVAAAVEVVTLVRSVTSSSYVDRLIRYEKLNPKLLELNHSKVINSINRINIIRDRVIR
ncbi:MAG: hypothetical protein RO469_01020 [Thermincola sp.]|nr:hypothetical protein [Thermincola sp.]MDT3702875.1 hypothetical protein [Thermincola sp.]